MPRSLEKQQHREWQMWVPHQPHWPLGPRTAPGLCLATSVPICIRSECWPGQYPYLSEHSRIAQGWSHGSSKVRGGIGMAISLPDFPKSTWPPLIRAFELQALRLPISQFIHLIPQTVECCRPARPAAVARCREEHPDVMEASSITLRN